MVHMTRPEIALMCMEKYAGIKTVAGAFQQYGFAAASFEYNDDPIFQNMLTGLGFAYGLACTIRLYKACGLNFEAPVCSTWIWLNRSTSGRSGDSPMGFQHLQQVADANLMVARTVIYLYIMSLLGCCWCIEQPSSSLLEKHVAFQWLCKQTRVYRVFVWIGSYGHDCCKPTFLYSNYKFFHKLYLPLPCREWTSNMVKRYIDSNGIPRICGDSDLKASQHYPRRFGCAVAECFLDHYEEVRQHVKETREELQRAPRKEAKDPGFAKLANLRQVIKELQ
ncbi:unnamed protein product [Cladocopium goreaui]|uniref:Uncharacterized protein n=1 Tax=Cladocopium goreaui TaxID=2562237 RepID=A0A9P1CFI5_9DINO|nr:unnamed protein product [Cladocopium goreaui]